MKTVLLLVSILCANLSYSQQEYSNWNVGNRVWLRFPGPTYFNGSNLNTTEGCASISDAITGNLLFYTNGVNVWNKFHIIMPNGTGLLGGLSSTQSAIILKQPGNTNLYYIFTVNQQASGEEFSYSIVDMTSNAGNGDVVVKNVLIHARTSEKLTASQHCNGVDWWVISHDLGSTLFRAVLLTSTGVTSTVTSSTTTALNLASAGSIGCMKVNQQGTKLASAFYSLNRLSIFDFNNSTGVVSNETNLVCNNGPYGLEFSPNGNFLYVTYNNSTNLHQYNLCNNSRISVGNPGSFIGSMQLQNDGRIYISGSVTNGSKLGVIYDPNLLGAACNYVVNVSNTPFAGQNFIFGLTQCFYNHSVFSYSYQPTYNIDCLTVEFDLPNLCTSQPINNVLWNFGDGSTSTLINPTHTYVLPNNYFGTVTINFNCSTLVLPITVSTSVTGVNNLNSN